MATSWDGLGKDARRLEADIDAKLAAFGRATAALSSIRSTALGGPASGVSTATSLGDAGRRRTAGAPNGNATSDGFAAAEHICTEVEGLLSRLAAAVDAMSRAQSATGSSAVGVGGGASRHMVARHADILRDYTTEFQRTQRALVASREAADGLACARAELLGGGGGGAAAVAGGLYAERSSLSAASTGADAALNAGAALREDLERQRQTFASMVARMDAVGERVPGINRLIRQIRRKKKRDVMVMALVVATLVFLTGLWKLA
ncbi:hypothetical protein I4F81_001089 [Pyropia yezoensis]|uniref:Uncharacterized protein n=1 Tax=Pyropia yezoensis TaxID=2788 RepID=A0ACC3BKP9_PYRYE|nr:hypothetical protein I4F81_001089 [Neopyropia yezoensis]